MKRQLLNRLKGQLTMMSEEAERQYSIQDLNELYAPIKGQIETRLGDFRQIWEKATDEELFTELVFCLLTPQSKAKTCWKAVQRLTRKKMISEGEPCQIQEELFGVRFNRRKAEYICLAKKTFSSRSLRTTLNEFDSPFAAREWLVDNVLGLGYKEASHFLRNIGLGSDLAILDRHILKNLTLLGVIDEVPSSLSRKTYLDIERRMTEFSEKIEIPMGQLDLLLWYKEAGEVFK
jgi:N-glycosylase/DNA lyase